MLKISAFLFAALIFFVSFFYQEKKENRDYLKEKSAYLLISSALLSS
jgi:hypothetical protein